MKCHGEQWRGVCFARVGGSAVNERFEAGTLLACFDDLYTSAETDFGQTNLTDFGHTNLTDFGHTNLTDFGTSNLTDFGTFFSGIHTCRVWKPKGGAPKGGPRPKFNEKTPRKKSEFLAVREIQTSNNHNNMHNNAGGREGERLGAATTKNSKKKNSKKKQQKKKNTRNKTTQQKTTQHQTNKQTNKQTNNQTIKQSNNQNNQNNQTIKQSNKQPENLENNTETLKLAKVGHNRTPRVRIQIASAKPTVPWERHTHIAVHHGKTKVWNSGGPEIKPSRKLCVRVVSRSRNSTS